MSAQGNCRKGSSVRWAVVLCTVGPAAALGVYALSGGSTTPASAVAAPPRVAERATKIDLPEPSPAHQALLAAKDDATAPLGTRSPMVEAWPEPIATPPSLPQPALPAPAVKPQTPADEPVAPTPLPVEELPSTPDFTLTSILRLGGNSTAIVNGKRRVIGDEVVEGWRVTAIDAAAGSVTLSGPKDMEATVVMKRAGGR